MCTVYLLSERQKMSRNGGRIEIRNYEGKRLYSLTIDEIDSVVVAGNTQISTDVVFSLLDNDIQISYLDFRGRVIGVMGGEKTSLERLLLQQKCFDDAGIVADLIRYTVGRKLENQRRLLATYASSQRNTLLKEAATTIHIYERKLSSTDNPEELRGFEGIASKVYFDAFGEIFDSKTWDWNGRNRRPPRDPVNSMLSYGYAFLEREVRAAIAGVRLDARIGFFHSNNGRKDSLVYDLLEMFRQNIIDKFVLKLLNRQLFYPIDFITDEENGCTLSDVAKRKWIAEYEKYMAESRKMIDGDNWRQYIRKEVEEFANIMLTKMAEAYDPCRMRH